MMSLLDWFTLEVAMTRTAPRAGLACTRAAFFRARFLDAARAIVSGSVEGWIRMC